MLIHIALKMCARFQIWEVIPNMARGMWTIFPSHCPSQSQHRIFQIWSTWPFASDHDPARSQSAWRATKTEQTHVSLLSTVRDSKYPISSIKRSLNTWKLYTSKIYLSVTLQHNISNHRIAFNISLEPKSSTRARRAPLISPISKAWAPTHNKLCENFMQTPQTSCTLLYTLSKYWNTYKKNELGCLPARKRELWEDWANREIDLFHWQIYSYDERNAHARTPPALRQRHSLMKMSQSAKE